MTDLNTADVTIHLDENLDKLTREDVRDAILAMDGVMAANCREKTPHLMMVVYGPEKVNSQELLETVQGKGVHAELIGM